MYRIFNNEPLINVQQQYWYFEKEIWKAVATFITQQLEKNQEDPLAILEMLNDPRFDRFMLAEDGSQIQLDPATRAASVTLLGLQNQFATANPSIGRGCHKSNEIVYRRSASWITGALC